MADDDVKMEMETALRRAGVDVPPERMALALATYKDFKTMTALLRQPRSAANEPAGHFSLVSLMKEG